MGEEFLALSLLGLSWFMLPSTHHGGVALQATASSFNSESRQLTQHITLTDISFAMSLDPPTYLSSLQNNIRARPIPWEGAVRAGTITENDLKRIKAVDKVRKEQRKQTVEADTGAYQSLLLGGDNDKSVLESASKRADVIQYILVLTGDLINGMTTVPRISVSSAYTSRCPIFRFSPP